MSTTTFTTICDDEAENIHIFFIFTTKTDLLFKFDGFTLIDQSKTVRMVLLVHPEPSSYVNQIT